MNPNTGELRLLRSDDEEAAGFERLAGDLNRLARLKIARAEQQYGNAESARVNLRSTHPLADWAKKKRKAKIAAASRRRNRR